MPRSFAIFLVILSLAQSASGLTDTVRVKPDIRRAALHEDIDREQERILA